MDRENGFGTHTAESSELAVSDEDAVRLRVIHHNCRLVHLIRTNSQKVSIASGHYVRNVTSYHTMRHMKMQ